MKKSRVRQGLLLLLMVFFCAVIMLPFLIMFFTSLKTSSEIAAPVFRLLPEKWLFSNYADAMKSVSYTHLDVYKRQPSCYGGRRSEFPMHGAA